MLSRIAIALFFLTNSYISFAQTIIKGNITTNENHGSKLYIAVMEVFSRGFKTIDSIRLDSNGNFYHILYLKEDNLLVRLLLPPKGGNSNSIVEGYADNFIYLPIEDKAIFDIKASSDSLYFSSMIKLHPTGKQIMQLKELKRPFYHLAMDMMQQIASFPDSAETIQKQVAPAWIETIKPYKAKLKEAIMKETHTGLILLGLYYLYQADFGTYDSIFFAQTINRISDTPNTLVANIKHRLSAVNHKRTGSNVPNFVLYNLQGKFCTNPITFMPYNNFYQHIAAGTGIDQIAVISK